MRSIHLHSPRTNYTNLSLASRTGSQGIYKLWLFICRVATPLASNKALPCNAKRKSLRQTGTAKSPQTSFSHISCPSPHNNAPSKQTDPKSFLSKQASRGRENNLHAFLLPPTGSTSACMLFTSLPYLSVSLPALLSHTLIGPHTSIIHSSLN